MSNTLLVNGNLICVALNDAAQVASLKETFSQPPYQSPPQQPVLYFKPRNTWNRHGAVVPWAVDLNGEPVPEMVVGASLGVVIGQVACRVKPESALELIRGYTIVHDFSLPELGYYRPDIKGKCLDGSAPVGPIMADTEIISDPAGLTLETAINDDVKVRFAVTSLKRSIPALIHAISHIMTLQPGEVIAVGFAGERLTLAPGDRVVTVVDGIGELANTLAGGPG